MTKINVKLRKFVEDNLYEPGDKHMVITLICVIDKIKFMKDKEPLNKPVVNCKDFGVSMQDGDYETWQVEKIEDGFFWARMAWGSTGIQECETSLTGCQTVDLPTSARIKDSYPRKIGMGRELGLGKGVVVFINENGNFEYGEWTF